MNNLRTKTENSIRKNAVKPNFPVIYVHNNIIYDVFPVLYSFIMTHILIHIQHTYAYMYIFCVIVYLIFLSISYAMIRTKLLNRF